MNGSKTIRTADCRLQRQPTNQTPSVIPAEHQRDRHHQYLVVNADNAQMDRLVDRKVCEDIKIFNIQYKLEFSKGVDMKTTSTGRVESGMKYHI